MGWFASLFGNGGGYNVPPNRNAHRPAGMSDHDWKAANHRFDSQMTAYRHRAGLNSDNSPAQHRKQGGPGGRR